MGALNIFIWSGIIMFDLSPHAEKNFLTLIFLWIAEIIVATFLITAGIASTRRQPMRRALVFIALGALLGSANASFWNYSFNFDLIPFVLSLLFFLSAVVIAGWNYNNWRDIIFLSLAFSAYGSYSLLVLALPKSEYGILAISIPVFALSILAIIVFYNNIFLKERIVKNNK